MAVENSISTDGFKVVQGSVSAKYVSPFTTRDRSVIDHKQHTNCTGNFPGTVSSPGPRGAVKRHRNTVLIMYHNTGGNTIVGQKVLIQCRGI